ncbi:MAG: hypothetical protein JSV00_02480 [bacterium]|nr:MAG: hypothetical protein JSV00_02480 [bacterium]
MIDNTDRLKGTSKTPTPLMGALLSTLAAGLLALTFTLAPGTGDGTAAWVEAWAPGAWLLLLSGLAGLSMPFPSMRGELLAVPGRRGVAPGGKP